MKASDNVELFAAFSFAPLASASRLETLLPANIHFIFPDSAPEAFMSTEGAGRLPHSSPCCVISTVI